MYDKKYSITDVTNYLENKKAKCTFSIIVPYPLHIYHRGKKVEWVNIKNDYIYMFLDLDNIYIDLLKASIPFMIRIYWNTGNIRNSIYFVHQYTIEKKLKITKVRNNISYSKDIQLNEYELELIELSKIMDLI